MKPFISVRALIDANLRYLSDGKLGAQTGTHACRYRYQWGARCAIGAVLPDRTLERIVRSGLNQEPVQFLTRRVTMESFTIFAITQAIHDKWVTETIFTGIEPHKKKEPPVPPEVLEFVSANLDKDANEAMFRKWLDLLDRLYPAEGAAQ